MPKRNLAWVVVIVMVAAGLWQLPKTAARLDSLDKTFGPMMAVRAKIAKHYVDSVDDEALVAGAIRGMLSELDPYSNYISAKDYAAFQQASDGEYGGVGIELGRDPDGQFIVVSPIEDSPAFHAGVLAGDRILAVDNEPLKSNTLIEDVVNLIMGEAGTTVTLTVQHPTQPRPREIPILRDRIALASVKGWYRQVDGAWDYFLDLESRIAYIRLTSFVEASRGDLERAIAQVREQRMAGLILDLRNNGGGLLSSAVSIADLFLPEGTIVTTKRMDVQLNEWKATREGTLPAFPLVVLINRNSASASEIVAGALRDHQRATIVGERSYGKGSVQNVYTMPEDNTALKLTVAYYHLPNGECIHRTQASEKDALHGAAQDPRRRRLSSTPSEKNASWGVAPDVEVLMTDEELVATYVTRREADVIRPPSTAPSDDDATTRPAPTTQVGSPPMDRQLAKAIEVLREKLDLPTSEAAPPPTPKPGEPVPG